MYSNRITKPRDKDTNQSTIDLDSDTIDYDINSKLYTPLPEPKFMQISSSQDSAGAAIVSFAEFCNIAKYWNYLDQFKLFAVFIASISSDFCL